MTCWLFATFSEGFRAGGFNRNGQGTGPDDIPFFFESDDIQNYEIGWKTRFFGGALQFNGAGFFIDFEDMQTQVLDFTLDNISFLGNAGDAEIWGTEFDLGWFITDELSTFVTFAYNNTEITSVPEGVLSLAPEGSELALAPEFQWNWRGRYETTLFDDYRGFGQVNVRCTDDSFSDIVIEPNRRFPMDSYTQVDLSFGVSTGQWSGRVFIDNVTDKAGELFVTDEDDVFRERLTRPRTFGFRLSYDTLQR